MHCTYCHHDNHFKKQCHTGVQTTRTDTRGGVVMVKDVDAARADAVAGRGKDLRTVAAASNRGGTHEGLDLQTVAPGAGTA